VRKNEQLRERTKQFAIGVIHLFKALPDVADAQMVGNQLLRCGTCVGARYSAVRWARSKADFIARLRVVAEEADESVFWLELIEETRIINPSRLEEILKESRELSAIFSASLKTARSNR
jgi:four helix bundle protein